jgi:N-acetyltransferase
MPWTVTNSFKRYVTPLLFCRVRLLTYLSRGLMKTYGRPLWRVYDDDQNPAAKKRRVQAGDESGDEAESNLQYAIRESSAAILSSPSRRNSLVLSEATQDDDLSTPPSSPPSKLSPPTGQYAKTDFFVPEAQTFSGQGWRQWHPAIRSQLQQRALLNRSA